MYLRIPRELLQSELTIWRKKLLMGGLGEPTKATPHKPLKTAIDSLDTWANLSIRYSGGLLIFF